MYNIEIKIQKNTVFVLASGYSPLMVNWFCYHYMLYFCHYISERSVFYKISLKTIYKMKNLDYLRINIYAHHLKCFFFVQGQQ